MAQIFGTLLQMSFSAAILALLVLGARLLIARRHSVLMPLLFALLLVRLAVPAFIPSPLSIQNLFHAAPSAAVQTGTAPASAPLEASGGIIAQPADLSAAGGDEQAAGGCRPGRR